MSNEGGEEMVPDYSKFNADSVPPPEQKDVKHKHPGRPDLDYDDTPVGPAPGVDYVPESKLKEEEQQKECSKK